MRAKKLEYFAHACETFVRSEQGRAYAQGQQRLAADGTFRLERVPATAYWIDVYPDGAREGIRVRNLEMPLLPGGTSDRRLDLGELKLPGADR